MRRLTGLFVAAGVLALVSGVASAQAVTNPTTVTFTASPDRCVTWAPELSGGSVRRLPRWRCPCGSSPGSTMRNSSVKHAPSPREPPRPNGDPSPAPLTPPTP